MLEPGTTLAVNNGIITGDSGSYFEIAGGTVTVDGTLSLSSSINFVNNGILAVNTGASLIITNSSLLSVPAGNITVASNANLTINPSASLTLDSGGYLTIDCSG